MGYDMQKKNLWRKDHNKTFTAELSIEEWNEIISFLRKNKITNVDFVKESYQKLLKRDKTYLFKNNRYNISDLLEILEQEKIIKK